MKDQITINAPRLLSTVILLVFCNACAAARIQMPSAPDYGLTSEGHKDLTFVLRSFKIKGQTNSDSHNSANKFRKAFLDHIDALSSFSRVIDGTVDQKTFYDSAAATYVDVTVNLESSHDTNWFLAFPAIYPFIGMWPLVPINGEARVRISARAKSNDGNTMWSKTSQGKRKFEMKIFSWYRTAPIEEAFKVATDQALNEILFDFHGSVPQMAALISAKQAPVVQANPPQPEPPIAIPVSKEQKSIPVADRPVVAVFDIEDTRQTTERLSKVDMTDLTNYLTSLLAGTKRFTTVPRSDLRKVLAEQKAETYQACYDESCQIEIGKEVAAEKSLATKLNRLGKKCVVTLTLFDLRKSITEDSVNTRGGCSTDNLTEVFEQLVPKLGASL